MALDLNSIQDDFKNEMGGGMYVPKVTEGTILDAFDIKTGIRGTQQLNTIAVAPTWKTNHDAAVDDDGGSPFYGVAANDSLDSDVDFSAVTLTVGTEFFQAPINPYVFDQSYLRASGSYYDPQLAAMEGIMAAAVKQGRKRFTEAFFDGIGASSPTNGLNDLTTNQVSTSASGNILAQLAEMHAEVAGSAIGGDSDQVIILNAADYVAYRQALRTSNYNDVLQTQATETGLMMSQFIDDPRVTIIGDANQSSSQEAIWTSKENLVVATSALRDEESPEIFYDKLTNTWIVRMFAALGVQAYQSGATGLVFENNPS